MEFAVRTDIDLPVETTWHKAALEFGDTGEWSARLSSSSLDRDEVGLGANRVCRINDETLTERILLWEPEHRRFAYTLIERPSWIREVTNTWSIHERGPGASTLEMTVDMDLHPLMAPLAPLVKVAMKRILRDAQAEFKHWAETGTPHPRKAAANAKFAKWRTAQMANGQD